MGPHPTPTARVSTCAVFWDLCPAKSRLAAAPWFLFLVGSACLFFFFNPLHTHLTSSVFPSSPSKFPAAPRRVGSRSRSRGGCGAWHTPAARTAAPAPGSSARVPATSLGSDTAALLPARGRPPPVPRQRCPPCACRLSAGRGWAVLRGSGNSCDIQNTENRIRT